jgi:predicted nucleic acid-binding protein
MKILVDTNVILDVLLQRHDFYDNSCAVFKLVEQRQIDGGISASAFTDIFYLVNKEIKNVETVYAIADTLTAIFTITPVFDETIKVALGLRWKDFEDAVQYTVARENNFDCIITRNIDDYETPAIPCYRPTDFLSFFQASN